MKKFVFTCGDTNGIGPEIVLKAIDKIYRPKKNKLILVIPSNIFEESFELVKPSFPFSVSKKTTGALLDDDNVLIISTGKAKLQKGFPTKDSGKHSFLSIKNAFELTSAKITDAMITAPISKYAFKLAGIDFPGHTELLGEWCGTKNFVMTFLSPKMKCALVTIHEPVKNIPRLITKKRLTQTLNVIENMLLNDFKKDNPGIAVLGLNPHAGENGKIGREELDIINPVIASFPNAHGPFVPDAFFANHKYLEYDIVIGMYHDQVLIPFKMLYFDKGVNYTAGLPIIRTSPDHGTAYDIAWKNIADFNSIVESYKWADIILSNRNK